MVIPSAVVMMLVSIYLVVGPFSQAPLESIYWLLLILSGVPVYLVLVRYKHVVPQWYWNAVGKSSINVTSCSDSFGSCCLDLFVKNIMEPFENTTAFFVINQCISTFYVC